MLKRAGTVLLAVAVAAMFLVTLGAFVPIPVLDILGALVSSVFPWLIVAGVILAVLAWTVRSRKHTMIRAGMVALSALSLLGSLVMGGRLVSFAVDQHLPISATQVLFGSHLHDAPDTTTTYTRYKGKAVTLSIWKPAPSSTPAPVIVMTHGGGFTAGSVTSGVSPAYARWFADHGYLVIGANYTLATKTTHTWNLAEKQLACALAWTGTNATRYGGDATRLGMFGDSAGGNLAVNVAYKADSGVLTSSCGGTTPQVDAVSGIYPAVGTIESYSNNGVLGAAARQFLGDYHGGSPSQVPDRYAHTESRNAITAAAPPTLIVYGGSDHLVPRQGTQAFVTAATKAGVSIRAIRVPFGEHGFDAVNMGGIGSQVWRLATLRWFQEHGVRLQQH